MSSSDTGRTDMQSMTLDLLREIRDRLVDLEGRQRGVEELLGILEGRQQKVEGQLGVLTTDVNTVHKFQKNITTRLNIVEDYCVDQPLGSTPDPRRADGDGR